MAKKHLKKTQDLNSQVEVFRDKWPHGKLSLLTAHLIFALDETRDLYGWTESENMDEAEKMFLQLMVDLKKLHPERREKPNVREIEKELFKEEELEDDMLRSGGED